MAKAKPGAKKSQSKPAAKKAKPSVGLVKTAAQHLGKLAGKLVRGNAGKAAPPAPAKPEPQKPASKPLSKKPEGKKAEGKKGGAKSESGALPSAPAVVYRPRATKLPPLGEALTPREMEQILTVGQGRGVFGEGSLKGRLIIKEGLPTLAAVGRDKRELHFTLQGPDQEVLPAYVDHKVSVTGLIKKMTSQGGSVDVRKYSAKKPETEVTPETPVDQKLRYLSPGEMEQLSNAGMGAGMRGFGSMRGSLELSGDDYFLVVSNGGTRQQVSFVLEGKTPKGLRKNLGQVVQVMGVVDKTSGWGGRIRVEAAEARPSEYRAVSRETLQMEHVEASGGGAAAEVKLNQGLTVRLPERVGHTWAIEPTMAKRISLREANFEVASGGTQTREFFFTPRNPGIFEVEFFLAKAFNPAQVAKTFKLNLTVRTA
jgi:hypothetical protein